MDRPGQDSAAPLWAPFNEAREERCFAGHDQFTLPAVAGGKHLFGEPVRIELREGPGAAGLERLRRRSELVVPRKAGLLAGLIEWFPEWGRRILARAVHR